MPPFDPASLRQRLEPIRDLAHRQRAETRSAIALSTLAMEWNKRHPLGPGLAELAPHLRLAADAMKHHKDPRFQSLARAISHEQGNAILARRGRAADLPRQWQRAELLCRRVAALEIRIQQLEVSNGS